MHVSVLQSGLYKSKALLRNAITTFKNYFGTSALLDELAEHTHRELIEDIARESEDSESENEL